jgi:hypothetical protein
MTKKWVVVKMVVTTSAPVFGCVVGPFKTPEDADQYAKDASIGSLGYEKWIVTELLPKK